MDKLWLQRMEWMAKPAGIEKLAQSHVLIVGLGGVGGYVAEMLCRAGIGELSLVDGDVVHSTNRNRQLAALVSTEGKLKTEVIAQRLLEINPEIKLHLIPEFLRDEAMVSLLESKRFDYVVDAIDTLSPKVYLLFLSLKNNLKVVSSMGSGGRWDPTAVKIADISRSNHCALARTVRKRLHKMGVFSGVEVVYSAEIVNNDCIVLVDELNKKSNVGTISYMPAVFGCACASVVIRGLLAETGSELKEM